MDGYDTHSPLRCNVGIRILPEVDKCFIHLARQPTGLRRGFQMVKLPSPLRLSSFPLIFHLSSVSYLYSFRYIGWKKLIPQNIINHDRVRMYFNIALEAMNLAVTGSILLTNLFSSSLPSCTLAFISHFYLFIF